VAGCLLAATGCGATQDEYNPPGANARIGSMLIRYAHIAEPAEPADGPWEPGDDAPLYVWLFNQGQRSGRLPGAETTIARSVDIVTAAGDTRGPVDVPTGKLLALNDGQPHLLLRGLREQLRGDDFAWATLRFERAGEVALQVHAQLPTYEEKDATKAPGLTPPSPSP
jgi:copper(I)-binding protein